MKVARRRKFGDLSETPLESLMKLYVTFTSPYSRLARIMVLEKGLDDRVEVIGAKTRAKDSPYYQINPSGRVPYLIDESGVGMEAPDRLGLPADRVRGAQPVRGDLRLGARDGPARERAFADDFVA
jgi:glutathione S-transferase